MMTAAPALDPDVVTIPGARVDWRRLAVPAAIVALAIVGLVLRAHLLTHQQLNGDVAVAGLMADQIRHGHFYTFYWGNQYGGGGFYIDALSFALFGSGPVVLNATAAAVAALSAVLLWRVLLRVVPQERRWLAGLAAAVFWVWPEAALWNSTSESGFRPLTMAAGIAAILLAMRTVENRSTRDAAATGVALGVGWWSSPEIIYFMVVALGIIGLEVWRHREAAWLRRLLPLAAGFGLGALPWIWTNLHTGLASLRLSSSPGYAPLTYTGRLSLFLHMVFPMMLGLRRPVSGAWVGGPVGRILYILALAALAALCVRGLVRIRRSPLQAACCAGLLLFPFEYAAFPATSYWLDGHYGVFCLPLVILVVAGGVSTALRRPAVDLSAAAAAIAVVVLTITAYNTQFLNGQLGGLLKGGPDPNRAALTAIADLQTNGIREGYADYWVAYDLDFLSHERLDVTDPSVDRWVALYQRVRRSPDPAWIFYAPTRVPEAVAQFGSPNQGPFAYPESEFLTGLAALGIGYRIVHAGVLDAVVTDRPVLQEQVGMGPPVFR